MARNPCVDRLQKEYRKLLKEPSPNIKAHPTPGNLLEWHYALEGPKDSDYEGGVYHGKCTFPKQYPFKPPSICMLTPSGRFEPNTNLCLSMTDFHPESWSPSWSVGTILTGLLSFMLDSAATTGAITASKEERHKLAHQSWQFNTKNPTFRKLFPEYLQPPPSSSPDPPPSGRGRPQPGHKVKAAPAEPPSSEPSSSARGGVGRGGEARESDPANHATSPGGSAAGGVGAGAQQAPEAAGGSEGSEDVGGNNDLPGKEQEQAAANKEAISQAIQDAMQQLRDQAEPGRGQRGELGGRWLPWLLPLAIIGVLVPLLTYPFLVKEEGASQSRA